MNLVKVVYKKSVFENEFHYAIYINGLFRISILSFNAVKLFFKEQYNFDFLEEMLGEQIYVS